jgi:endogenous inhibitor of DNA gyrase (YacG/DUF329 family)
MMRKRSWTISVDHTITRWFNIMQIQLPIQINGIKSIESINPQTPYCSLRLKPKDKRRWAYTHKFVSWDIFYMHSSQTMWNQLKPMVWRKC